MDEYQHALFFEARTVTDGEKNKIWRHFQKKRDSGGGDCVKIEDIGGNVYKVRFKEKEVQERVLQRKVHTISLSGGELRLTVGTTNPQQATDPEPLLTRTNPPQVTAQEPRLTGTNPPQDQEPLLTGTNPPQAIVQEPRLPRTNPQQAIVKEPCLPRTNPPQAIVQEPRLTRTNPPQAIVQEPRLTRTNPPQAIVQEPRLPTTNPQQAIVQEPRLTRTNPPQAIDQEPRLTRTNPAQAIVQEPPLTRTNPPQAIDQEPCLTRTNPPQAIVQEPHLTRTNPPQAIVQEPPLTRTNPPQAIIQEPRLTRTNPAQAIDQELRTTFLKVRGKLPEATDQELCFTRNNPPQAIVQEPRLTRTNPPQAIVQEPRLTGTNPPQAIVQEPRLTRTNPAQAIDQELRTTFLKVRGKLPEATDQELCLTRTNPPQAIVQEPPLTRTNPPQAIIQEPRLTRTNSLKVTAQELCLTFLKVRGKLPEATDQELCLSRTNSPQAINQELHLIQTNPPQAIVQEPRLTRTNPPQAIIQEQRLTGTNPPQAIVQEPRLTRTNPAQAIDQEPRLPRTNPPQAIVQEPRLTRTNPPQAIDQEPRLTRTNPPQAIDQEPRLTRTNSLKVTAKELCLTFLKVRGKLPEATDQELCLSRTNSPQAINQELHLIRTNPPQAINQELCLTGTNPPQAINQPPSSESQTLTKGLEVAILEKSLPTRKELPIVEKFKLVEEEFSRGMRARHPEVKVLIGSATIILEGPEEEVQSGATELDGLIKNVKEKRVQLCTSLIDFMKSSDAVSKYQVRFKQSLKNSVFLNTGSNLVLSSLSLDAICKAEVVLKKELSVENVPLQGATAVPPDLDRLKEILNLAQDKANSQELRVNITFIQGFSGTPKVRLVGYSENVKELKDVLHNYQMNQVRTEELLKLPHPEMLDCFDKILKMIGLKQSEVTLTSTPFPYPCVRVSGPRRLVQETQQALVSVLAGLTLDTLVLDGPGAQRYFQAEGSMSKELVESSRQVIIREQQNAHSPSVNTKPSSTASPSIHTGTSGIANKMSLEIRLGSLVDEQVNVLVVPMLNKNLTSTKIGNCLLEKGGIAIKKSFDLAKVTSTVTPGMVLQVLAPPSLGWSRLFFIECLPWDGVNGWSVRALGRGLARCLELCVQQGWGSVAFPIIGPGIALKYPLTEACQVLTESLCKFGGTASSGSLSSIHIVLKPDDPNFDECYHKVYKHLRLLMNQGDQAISRSFTSDLDDVTVTVGDDVKLQVVFGDITKETTAGVVNPTDFVHFQTAVCKAILAVAGPEVEAELRTAKVNTGVVITHPGSFPCKAIIHVNANKDAATIKKLVRLIIESCQEVGLSSVAIPAICTGAGGLKPGVVADAILLGIKGSERFSPLHIRLVLIDIDVFLAFKQKTMRMFSTAETNRESVVPHVQQQQQQPAPSARILHTSSANQKSTFLFLGVSRKEVDLAMTTLKDLYQAQCSAQTFKKEELEGLTQDNIKVLKQLVETKGLYVQEDQSSPGTLKVSGLKDGVYEVRQAINASLHGSLRREVRVREEEDLYARVSWCILVQNNWERLPKTANYNLENKDVAGRIEDAQSQQWIVDLQRMEAKRLNGQTARLKRLQHLADFTLPLYWDNMAEDEDLKMVVLSESSSEYWTVKGLFGQTVSQTVIKIERLQNVHLRRAYEGHKKRISGKNRGKAGEKLLFHGSTKENCESIMKTGFNRSFCGLKAHSYGLGTYFAVNASYSAQPHYSTPAADGSQFMFVARVLTGSFTLGEKNMAVPPIRSGHDRYNSLVNNMANPTIYVVFHDNQSYPEYLITFK